MLYYTDRRGDFMALSVRLDEGTERLVESLARKRGQTKSQVIRDALGVLAKQEKGLGERRRPYDLVAHLVGCVDSGGARLSENTGGKFAELLREKARGRRSR